MNNNGTRKFAGDRDVATGLVDTVVLMKYPQKNESVVFLKKNSLLVWSESTYTFGKKMAVDGIPSFWNDARWAERGRGVYSEALENNYP